MSVPRRRYTIAARATHAAALQAKFDGDSRFGKGSARSKWSDMFTSAFVDESGVEWRVASGMLTEAQIARWEDMAAKDPDLMVGVLAGNPKHGGGDKVKEWKFKPKREA